MQHKIREAFRGIPDEFMTSNLASQAKVIFNFLFLHVNIISQIVKYSTYVNY